MKFSTLSQRHPCCDPGLFRRYLALYQGGQAFRRNIKEFLPKNPLEPEDIYALRIKEAPYRSYAGPAVDFFSAQLFASPFLVRATRNGEVETSDPFYGDFREDVDLDGTDLVSFMKARFTCSMVKGCSWWVAEMPEEGDTPAESRLDWDARGLGRVRLCPLEPEDVLDWEVNDYGQLLWAVTHKKEMRRDDPRLARQVVTETWRLYDDLDVETFQVVYDPQKKALKPEDEIPSIGRVPHKFTRVPLISMRLPAGLWLMDRAADAQLEHFRLSSALGWAIRRTCYPMAFLHTAEKTALVSGAGYCQLLGLEDKFEWVSPPTASFDVLAKEIDAQKTELFRLVQQLASSVNNSSAAIGRSGESKQADNAASEICLHAYAVEVKEAIEGTFELISDGRGDTDLKFSIEGMNSFSLDDVTVTLANMKSAGMISIPSPTLKKELAKKAANLLLPDASQETKDKIHEEIETSEERMPVPPVPPLPGQDPNSEEGSDDKSDDSGEEDPPFPPTA